VNREDIIRMMQKAGLTRTKYAPSFHCLVEIAFAEGAAAEREECAKVCDKLEAGLRKTTMKQHQDYLDGNRRGISECAFAIRARGQNAKS
jgi:hypothetical protein